MSAILDRLPALATTGVGSLPFARPADAARHALGGYAVPFCPQLPRLDGDMVSEWLGTDPGRCGWTTDRDRERPAAWDAFVEQLAAKPPDHGIAKLQVTGPVTLAIALERGAGRVGAGASVVSLARDVCVWLAANAAGQVRRLAEVGIDALVVVDEPGLAHAGVSAVETELWDPLRSVSSAWGLHVCGRVPWELIRRGGARRPVVRRGRSWPSGGVAAGARGAAVPRRPNRMGGARPRSSRDGGGRQRPRHRLRFGDGAPRAVVRARCAAEPADTLVRDRAPLSGP